MSAALTGIRGTRIAGPFAALIALGAIAVANFMGDGENGGAVEFAVSAVVMLAVAVLLFGRVVPKAEQGPKPGRVALVLAVIATLTLVAFWSGLPQIIAPAAIVLGMSAPRSRESVAAVTLGTVAYALALVGVFVG
jgi:Mg2+/Co2+ transporter CorB